MKAKELLKKLDENIIITITDANHRLIYRGQAGNIEEKEWTKTLNSDVIYIPMIIDNELTIVISL